MHDEEERWVPSSPPDAMVSVVGGVSLALAPTVVLVVVFELAGLGSGATWTAADTARGLLGLPPGPFGPQFVGPLDDSGTVPLGLGVATWAGLVGVGWWTTGHHAETLPATDDDAVEPWPEDDSLVGHRDELHRRLASAVGRGVGRLYHRATERGFLRVLGRDGVAVGSGYALVVAVVVWRAAGPPAVTSEPWVGVVAGGTFAAGCATLGGLVRGCET